MNPTDPFEAAFERLAIDNQLQAAKAQIARLDSQVREQHTALTNIRAELGDERANYQALADRYAATLKAFQILRNRGDALAACINRLAADGGEDARTLEALANWDASRQGL
jgi:uncharacterized protein involved in exopolysaccharide biosynthesis